MTRDSNSIYWETFGARKREYRTRQAATPATAAAPGPIRPGRWAKVDPTRPGDLPKAPGVYVIFFDGDAVYVGQSNNVRNRLLQHAIRPSYGVETITPWGNAPGGVEVSAKVKIARRYGEWAMLELRLIRALRPRFNRQNTTVIRMPAHG